MLNLVVTTPFGKCRTEITSDVEFVKYPVQMFSTGQFSQRARCHVQLIGVCMRVAGGLTNGVNK